MHRTIALTTAIGFAMLPANPAAAEPATLIMEEHYREAGFEVDLYVTEDRDGGLLTEATLTDPDTGDVVDFWGDGTTVWWNGTTDGERVSGSAYATDFGTDPQEAIFCLTPYTALICIGAILIATEAGCKHLDDPCGGTHPTDVPGGAGGVPEGGGGDGDDDGGGQSGGGGDDN